MSKAVMLSIRPKWCEKIASGEKTIEVRKTRPKMNTPFKCYIYCTLPKYPHEDFIATDYPRPQFYGGGKVIGDFICDVITRVNICGFWDDGGKQLDNRLKDTCLTSEEFGNYLGENVGYGWHISNLKIYDTPRELSEFRRATDPCDSCPAEYTWECTGCEKLSGDIKRAPQSWCYVEAAKEGEKA
nr:MAG TPA: hypothetical protein [Caudoviricetes sp.]